MRQIAIFLMLIMGGIGAVHASIASMSYVEDAVAPKVDTAATANQTMAGSYTVSGTMAVPTPALPEPVD